MNFEVFKYYNEEKNFLLNVIPKQFSEAKFDPKTHKKNQTFTILFLKGCREILAQTDVSNLWSLRPYFLLFLHIPCHSESSFLIKSFVITIWNVFQSVSHLIFKKRFGRGRAHFVTKFSYEKPNTPEYALVLLVTWAQLNFIKAHFFHVNPLPPTSRPIVEGSKEIFLFIPVWRSSWLIFWACEVRVFHTQGGATGVWKTLT